MFTIEGVHIGLSGDPMYALLLPLPVAERVVLPTPNRGLPEITF